jgi:hypothetical protein
MVSRTTTGPCFFGCVPDEAVRADGSRRSCFGAPTMTKRTSEAIAMTIITITAMAAATTMAGGVVSSSRAAADPRRTPKTDHNTARIARRKRMACDTGPKRLLM